MTIACFTGHRKIAGQYYNHDNPTPEWLELRTYLQKALSSFMDQGIDHYISGMAIGVDQLAAETVALVRAFKKFDVMLIAAIPFPSQPSNWPQASQLRYKEILGMCNTQVVTSDDPYAPGKMHIRDEWMVNMSDYTIAIWDGRPGGGTYYTMQYALNHNKPVFHIDITKQPIEGAWINP